MQFTQDCARYAIKHVNAYYGNNLFHLKLFDLLPLKKE